MDIADQLNYTYEEQCFLQIAHLKEQILKEAVDSKVRRYCRKNRLFRFNIFEDVDPQHRKNLDRVLHHSLSVLGTKLSNNLKEIAREGRSSIRTPTPVNDLSSVPSVSSLRTSLRETRSRSRSRALSRAGSGCSNPRSRSRSASVESDLLQPVAEIIVISSDEEVDDVEPVTVVKDEPLIQSHAHEANMGVTLQDITNSANQCREQRPIQASGSEQQKPNQQGSESADAEKRKWPPNTLLVVDMRNPSNYIYDEQGVIFLKAKKHIKFCANKSRQALVLHTIAKVIELVGTDKYITKRELYYLSLDFCRSKQRPKPPSLQTQGSSGIETQNPSQMFSTQGASQPAGSQSVTIKRYSTNKLDISINDLCCLLGCSKIHLHIVTQSKGIVYGNLKFKLKNGELFDCLSKKEGLPLPTGQYPITAIESDAKFILVLEKDSILQNILSREDSSNFIKNYKVIVITARGYPDVISRAFLNFLAKNLKIPILALTDADPHGIEILCSYKFGCQTTAYEEPYLAVPQMRWLGLLPSDVIQLSLESNTVPLSPMDLRKIDSLIKRPYMKRRQYWISQLEQMRELGRKAELESLDSNGEFLVKTYLPNKLRFASWL